MRRLWLAVGLACCTLAAWAQGAAPVASLDRSRVGLGETVTLNIEVGDGNVDEPDLSALVPDFVVLGTSTNRSLSIVNGRREAHTILGIALRPRRVGHLTIPGISVGGQKTQPVVLDVEDRPDTPGDAQRTVSLEGSVEPAKGYVGQQFDYTLRLYYAVNLSDGQLGDPTVEGAEVRRVGSDANYRVNRGGRQFSVVERHYAIIPQRAGALQVQPPSFQGTAIDPSDIDAFFGGGQPVNAVARPVTINVAARPAAAGDGAWLPARDLQLTLDGLPPDGRARVGQALNLRMRVQATGLPFEALPVLSLPHIDGVDVYPDKANTGSGARGAWITGWRQQDFAVVPNRPGVLHIPEVTLHWWNVETDTAQVATLPAHDIQVEGTAATATPATPGAQAQPAAMGGTPAEATTAAPAAPAASGTLSGNAVRRVPWPWLFAAAMVLWLATVAAWVVTRRRPTVTPPAAPAPATVREGPARKAFDAAVAQGDAAAVEAALLAWARTQRPLVRSLSGLSAALSDTSQQQAIAMLQKARFAEGPWDAAALRQAFRGGFAWAVTSTPSTGSGLPPLYPT